MRRRTVLFVSVLLLVSAAGPVPVAAATSSCSFPVTATDATDTDVTVEAPPGRVVVLGPSAAQTMWEIDGEDRVVGMPVDEYTSYLPGHDDRVDIMNPDRFTVNIERVVELEPDLVLAPNVIPEETVTSLRDAGLIVYRFEFAADIDAVREKTLLTGRLTGQCDAAEDRVDWMDARLEVVGTAVADAERPTVIYPLGDGFVAGEGTFLHELIVAGGGENVAATANVSGYAQMSGELIVAEDPEWVVLNEELPTSAIRMDAYNRTVAVEEGQIIRVNPSYANQPAPRVVLAIETIVAALHPEAYAAANRSSTPSPTELPGESPATPTSSDGQPGFGVLVAVIGLLATVTLSRARRS